MDRRGQRLWHTLVAIVAMLAVALPVSPAMAQRSGPSWQIYIDAPLGGTTIFNGQQTLIGGWAADLAGPGTGVEEVRVYLDNPGGRLLGNATYGKPRPDVAQALGNQAFLNTGYDLLFTPTGISTGPHTIVVQARSTANGWQSQSIQVNVAGGPGGDRGDRYDDRMGDRYGDRMGDRYGERYHRPRMAGRYGDLSRCMQMMDPYTMGNQDYWDPMCEEMMQQRPRRRLIPPPPPPPPPPPLLLPAPIPGLPPTTPIGLPAPANVTVIGVSPTAVGLSWSPVTGATGYRVLQSTGGAPFVAANATQLTATSALVTGLMPNTTYQFQVVSLDASGQAGTPSPAILVMTTP